jgi:hypothetical protein
VLCFARDGRWKNEREREGAIQIFFSLEKKKGALGLPKRPTTTTTTTTVLFYSLVFFFGRFFSSLYGMRAVYSFSSSSPL